MVALRASGAIPVSADVSWFEEPDLVIADYLATLDDCWLTPRCIQRVESGMVGRCAAKAFRVQGERGLRERPSDGGAKCSALQRRSLDLARAGGGILGTAHRDQSRTSLAGARTSSKAKAVLEPVLARFLEGFGRADWLAARALLETL